MSVVQAVAYAFPMPLQIWLHNIFSNSASKYTTNYNSTPHGVIPAQVFQFIPTYHYISENLYRLNSESNGYNSIPMLVNVDEGCMDFLGLLVFNRDRTCRRTGPSVLFGLAKLAAVISQ